MTTARERYEAKTKVVTFRVSHELYDDLEEIRGKADLSFADLIKLGAGIAREEIEKKLSEVSELQDQLAELRKTIRQDQKTLESFIETTRKEQLAKLERRLGTQLVQRGGGMVTPPDAGQAFYRGAREILLRYEALAGEVRSAAEAIRGVLRVGTIYSVGMYSLDAYFKQYKRIIIGCEAKCIF